MSSGPRRAWLITGGIGAAAVIGAAGFVAWQVAERPGIAAVTPAPGGAVASASPTLEVALDNAGRLGDLRVTVDGEDVTGSVTGAGDRLMIPVAGLRDGTHRAAVSFRTDNLLARSVSREWDFEVDTKPPAMRVTGPAPGGLSKTRAVAFTGTGEPGARVAVTWKGGRAGGVVRPNGAFAVRARLPEGPVATTVAASDRAGNRTTASAEVVVDTVAPTLTVAKLPGGNRLTATDEPLIRGRVGGDDPARLVFGATVNGRRVVQLPGAAGVPAADSDGLQEVAASTAPLEVDGEEFQLAVGALPQGLNDVRVWVRDRAGNVATRRMRLFVDSTEDFGSVDLVQGARGEDARTLNARLKEVRLLKGKVTAQFGPRTRAALIRYQRTRKLKQTGMLDEATRSSMVGRIVVDLSDRRLKLIRGGRVVKTYRVAVGAPGYSTPTGDYEIIDLQTNPTWFPPDSPWARGLGPIPPGPGNPLGTRWIGTSAPAIGIHGTYASSSIGTAASHGCIRMHIPEVEELYEEVSLGMKVRFQA